MHCPARDAQILWLLRVEAQRDVDGGAQLGHGVPAKLAALPRRIVAKARVMGSRTLASLFVCPTQAERQ